MLYWWGINMSKIKVSVIIPVFNVEDYLCECLDSVTNQTLKDMEIICINDGSTDNSIEILKEYQNLDHRIKIFEQENKGPGFARNVGINNAQGEYIAFLDSDDFLDTKTYEKAYNKCKDLDLDCLFFKITTLDENNEFNENNPYFSLKVFDNFEKTVFNHYDTKNFTCNICVQVGSILFKKEFLDNNNIRFPEGLIFEDEPFFYKFYLSAKRVSILRENLYYYRINRKNSIISNREHFLDIVDIFKIIRQILNDLDKDKIYKKDFFNRFLSAIFNRYIQSPEEFKEEFFLNIKKDFKSCLLNQENLFLLNKTNKINSYHALTSENYKDFSKNVIGDYNQDNLLDNSIHFIYGLNNELLNSKRELVNKDETIRLSDEKIKEQEDLIKSKDSLIDEKDQQIFKKEDFINNLNDTINSKDKTINENNNFILFQENQINNLNNDLSDLNFRFTENINLISSLEKDNLFLTEENLQKNKRIENLLNDINLLKQKNDEQENQLNLLIQENNSLNFINNEIFSSNSWKITEPLRKFRRIFK